MVAAPAFFVKAKGDYCMNKQANSLVLSTIIFLVFVVSASWSIVSLTRYEHNRDLGNWQLTLGVMADSRTQTIADWIEGRFTLLQDLADNGSLQLYTQQLVNPTAANLSSEPAEISYLRNLLRSTAEQNGFVDQKKADRTIDANIAWHANNGLVLFDNKQEIITGTPGISEIGPELTEKLALVLASGRRALYDLHINANNQPVVGFLVPVFPLQRQSDNPRPMAVLYGFRDAEEGLFPFLTIRNAVTKTDESYLIQEKGDLLYYLSPLADGTRALRKSLSINAPDLVAAESIRQPGYFGQFRDYTGEMSLFTSRKVAGTPWILVQKVKVEEALAESKTHQNFLLISLVLALLLASALMVAAWWYGSTVRERKAVHELREKTVNLESQTDLLNAITDNITDCVFLLDGKDRILFSNRSLANRLGVEDQSLEGKSLSSAFGVQTAKTLGDFCRQARLEEGLIVNEMVIELADRPLSILSSFVPLPIEDRSKAGPVLVSLNDVTLVQEARQKKERLMSQIVSSLMRAIDLHDPYSANHSANTAILAVAIARALGVSSGMLATIATAGDLCNLGKLSIPRDLLTKQDKLTEDERKLLQKETVYACDILSQIDFDGPVLDVIAQKHELLDGSGYPVGLKGDEIIEPARILAVANAFVAMVSPRAYRDRMELREILDQFIKEDGERYGRHVVAALFHVAENNIDWQTWKKNKGIFVLKQNDSTEM